MSSFTPVPLQPAPAPAPPSPAPARSGTALGVAALATGIGTFLIGLVPLVGYVSWLIGLVGVALGAVAVHRAGRANGVPLGGIIAAGISVVTSIAMAVGWTMLLSAHSAPPTHTITYSVSGTGSADVHAVTWTAGTSRSRSSVVTLPYTETVEYTGSTAFLHYALSAQAWTWGDTTIHCAVRIDGRIVAADDASGESPEALCRSTN